MGHLANLLRRLYSAFFDADQVSGRFNLVDEYFASIERAFAEQVGNVVAQQLANSKAETDRFAEEARLSEFERRTKAEETRQQVGKWDELAGSINQVQAALHELDHARLSAVP